MQVQDRLYTVDDLKAMPDDGRIYELHNGVLVEVAGSKYRQTKIQAWLIHLIYAYATANKLGGRVISSDGTCTLSPHNTRVPDLAYLTAQNDARQDDDDYIQGAPDLVVEVLSPSNRRSEILQRIGAYQDAGSQIIWLVNPENRTVEVFGSDNSQRLFQESETLDGGDVLPGFQLPVATVFNVGE